MFHITLPEYDALINCGAFHVLNRKVELIRGELTEMNPAGPLHDDLLVYLMNWSLQHIDPAQTYVTSQTGLELPTQSSRPEPDLMWLRAARYRTHHPRAEDVQLAIEVADTSLAKDIEVKRRLYAEAGIIEYWIVDALSQKVHVYRQPNNGDYAQHTLHQIDEEIAPVFRSEAKLNLHKLFQE